jgi:hypothetical protein
MDVTAPVEDASDFAFDGSHTLYSACSACGFWRQRVDAGLISGDFLIPSIREFNPVNETPSLLHLTEQISRFPEKLYQMEPYQFERFVGSVFRECFNCEVYHVGQSGDDGVDLFAIVKDEPFLIQVKRRSRPTMTEGVEAVKLLFASAFGQGENHGAVITTAQRFSKAARTWAKSPRLVDINFKIQLVDFASLMSMVNCVAQKGDPPPWIAHKESYQALSFFHSDEGWTLATYDKHDVLARSTDSETTALIYEHRSLEDCIVLSGASKIIALALHKWPARLRTEALAQETGIRISLRRNDNDLESEMGVPWELARQLVKRWVALYPNRVVDTLFS